MDGFGLQSGGFWKTFSGSTLKRTKSDVEIFDAEDFQDADELGGFIDTGSSGNDLDIML